MGNSSNKIKILFSSYAGSPLFHFRVEVNGKSLLNPPGLLIDRNASVVITPIRDNSVEGEPVTLENFRNNVDLAVNVIRTDETPGFKAVYNINDAINHTAVFYYPNDTYHKQYNTHVIHTNIKSVNPSIITTKDNELSIYTTSVDTGDFSGPEMVLPLTENCGVYNVILDSINHNLRIEMMASGQSKDCEKYIYIEPL